MQDRTRPFKYLVVDDSEFARRTLIKVLDALGGTLAGEANSGLDAVQKYKSLKPDIVFMDITMPGVEGLDALEMIIAEDRAARIEHHRAMADEFGRSVNSLRIEVHRVRKAVRECLNQRLLEEAGAPRPAPANRGGP